MTEVLTDLERIDQVAKEVISDGFLNKLSDDAIKVSMMNAGVPFSKLNSLFKKISIEEGHIVDPKEVTAGLNELIQDIPWADYTEWDAVEKAVKALSEAVDGATTTRALSLSRAFCREEEIELPRKPKATGTGGGRTSKISNAVVDLVVDNPQVTKAQAFEVIFPLCTGANVYKNALYYVNSVVTVAAAAARGVTLASVVSEFASQADPVDPVEDPSDADEDDFE